MLKGEFAGVGGGGGIDFHQNNFGWWIKLCDEVFMSGVDRYVDNFIAFDQYLKKKDSFMGGHRHKFSYGGVKAFI